MIAIKSSYDGNAVVLLDPSQKDGTRYYDDDSFTPKETILFKANFPDSRSVTADENQNVYFSAGAQRLDRNPGYEAQYSLYKWTKETDVVPLTTDESSYFQPTVSRDGKLLVAVEQNGLKMRLVQIDTTTGEKQVLFQDERYSFIQPALNADGSMLAFVLLKEDRACIALANLETKEYKIVNNTEHDFITDPSSPSWNKDGSLNFCSNDRGRLEVFEVTPNSDGSTFTYVPAVSDPIAALWAYKNDFGVFYTSYASTGDVIKIKPLDEWKKVPDFEGPSPAGQVMTFRELEDDYPDFTPYAKVAEETTDEEAKENSEEADDKDENKKQNFFSKFSDKDNEEVKHRSEEATEKLNDLKPAVTELQNEKVFLGKLTPLLYCPLPMFISDKDDTYVGIGGLFYGQTARLQMKQGFIMLDAFYYPTLKNFTGDFIAEFQVGTGTLDFYLGRNNSLVGLPNYDDDLFALSNIALSGFTLPILSRGEMKSSRVLSALLYAGGIFTQQSEKAFSVNSDIDFSKSLSFHTGLDYSTYIPQKRDNYSEFSIVNLLLGNYDLERKKMFFGYEGEFAFKTGNNSTTQELSTVIRYTDFPSETIPFMSRAHFAGLSENCLFPGKILLNYALIFPSILGGLADGNIKVQGLASFGKNSDGLTPAAEQSLPLNFNIEKKVALNCELDFPISLGQKFTTGLSFLFDLNNSSDPDMDVNFYISCKMNWLRF